MAARNSLNAKNLEGLGAARLAALLMEISEGNAAARRTLRLALAESQGPVELAQEVRKRLAAVDRSSRWLDARDCDALLIDLERQRQVILGPIASEAPALLGGGGSARPGWGRRGGGGWSLHPQRRLQRLRLPQSRMG